MRRHQLASRRRARGYSQESLAHHLGVERTTVGRWERGESDPQPWNRPALAEALGVNLDGLAALLTPRPSSYADASPVPDATELFVDRRDFLSGALAAVALPALPMPPVTPGIIDHFAEQLRSFWQADRTFGPRLLVDSAVAHAKTVVRAADETTSDLRIELLGLGVAYTGLVSWLYQDAGDLPRCATWLSETLELAHRARDPQLVAYALTCKALVKADAGDGPGTVDLAVAALKVSDELGPKARVMAMQHAAYGHALNGDRAAVDRLLDEIALLLNNLDDDEPWGGDRLRRPPDEVVSVHRATCYDRLGLADEAVPLWDRVMIHAVTERRDRGVHLARHASTLIGVGNVDAATDRATEGLQYLRQTGSARMRRELLRVRDKAGPGRVHEVLAAIA